MAWSFRSEMNPAMSMAATAPACHAPHGCPPSGRRRCRAAGGPGRGSVAGRPASVSFSHDDVMDLLHRTALAVRGALDSLDDWGPAGRRSGQYASDLVADTAALAVLEEAGVGVLSEESGVHRPESDLMVVVDPLDGSTNAARGIPWFATSLCAVDAEGPLAALVVDLAHGRTYTAVRGK